MRNRKECSSNMRVLHSCLFMTSVQDISGSSVYRDKDTVTQTQDDYNPNL